MNLLFILTKQNAAVNIFPELLDGNNIRCLERFFFNPNNYHLMPIENKSCIYANNIVPKKKIM